MPGGTVRIRKETQTILRELAVSEGKPMQTILALALEEYRRQRFLREANAALYHEYSQFAHLCRARAALWLCTLPIRELKKRVKLVSAQRADEDNDP